MYDNIKDKDGTSPYRFCNLMNVLKAKLQKSIQCHNKNRVFLHRGTPYSISVKLYLHQASGSAGVVSAAGAASSTTGAVSSALGAAVFFPPLLVDFPLALGTSTFRRFSL